MGGTGGDAAAEIYVDSDGDLLVAGQADSGDFPMTSPNPAGPIQSAPGRAVRDVFVAKLNADGSALIYATYSGGNGDDAAQALAVDSVGNADLTGITQSSDFPTVSPNASGPFQATAGVGSRDAVVAKLVAVGAALVFATFVGGNDFDTAEGLVLDAAGDVYVTGMTRSGNFPLLSPDPAGPFQTSIQSYSVTGFVTKIRPSNDNEGPGIWDVTATPPVTAVNSPAALTANVDDANTGGSVVTSAEHRIDGGAHEGMAGADGAFDEQNEDVTALIGSFGTPGVCEVCVRATDTTGNAGGDEGDCVLLPVYDPNGGFATCGGAVELPASADLDNGVSGTARFGSKSTSTVSRSDGRLSSELSAVTDSWIACSPMSSHSA